MARGGERSGTFEARKAPPCPTRGNGGGWGRRQRDDDNVRSSQSPHNARGQEKEAKDADAATPLKAIKTGHAADQEGKLLRRRRATTTSQAAVSLWRGRRAARKGAQLRSHRVAPTLESTGTCSFGHACGGECSGRWSAHPSGTLPRGRHCVPAASCAEDDAASTLRRPLSAQRPGPCTAMYLPSTHVLSTSISGPKS